MMVVTSQKSLGLSHDERDHHIIERLSGSSCPVSGEALASELGVSRVALWKRIESLKVWGYGIEASRKGYKLVRNDGLAGWELDAPGQVLLFDTVGSTMDEARALAAGGAPSGAAVLALGQTSGRGRNGGVWESPSGGLYLSFVIRSRLPTSHAGALSLEVALAVMRALAEAGASSLEFSWPNSILACSGKPVTNSGMRPGKVGGILVEAYGEIGKPDFFIVGLGLNTAPRELAVLGGASGNGAPARRSVFAASIVRSLVAWAADPRLDPARWQGLVPGRGCSMTLELWNGSRRVFVPTGFNDRGDLVSSKGGPAVSIGECCRLYKEGDAD
jgi:BirA family biotin operon repressor/biotin-[acetyl-CoA-carboxylase] ligase